MAIASTISIGSPDLDTRPPEMKRSTIFAWVQRCPDCGYCSSDLSVSRPGADAAVNSPDYKDQLNNPAYPELANSFLCKAIVDRESFNLSEETWDFIHAAWACDDSQNHRQASECRRRAAETLLMANYCGEKMADQEGATTALLVDLLRRSGQFDRAKHIIESRRNLTTEDIIRRILDFQYALIQRNDTHSHTIEEALINDDIFQDDKLL